MRHLPLVGAIPTPSRATPHLLIKQDNNGDTLLISAAEICDIDAQALITDIGTRQIGAWALGGIDVSDEPVF